MMALAFCPIDRFSLRFERTEHMVRMIFDDIILNRAPLGRPLGRASTYTFAILFDPRNAVRLQY
jgi:hypothetical protein